MGFNVDHSLSSFIYLIYLFFDVVWLQIEILGVSLPWRSVFTNEGLGIRLIEHVKKFQEESNPFLSSPDVNQVNPPSIENVTPPVQASTSTDPFIDLLTGVDPLSHPLAQPVTENVVYEESDALDFLDQAVVAYSSAQSDHKNSSSEAGRYSDTRAEQYLNCLGSLTGLSLVCYHLVNFALSLF